MSKTGWKRTAVLLAGIVVFLVLGFVGLTLIHAKQTVEIAFAEDQTDIFDQMFVKARASSDLEEITACRNYVRDYYPSGTKQPRGSLLDRAVERHRELVLAAIEERLQSVAGRLRDGRGAVE